MIIKSGRIYMEDGCKAGYLEIDGGIIKRFHPEDSGVAADIDYGDNRVIPGIFDTHNHGGFGVNVSAATEEEIKLYLKGLAANGVTCIFPTTTEPEAMRLLAKMADELQDGARIMGIHSEGPWGSRVGEKGINTGYPNVDLDHGQELYDACAGKLRLIGVAPEVDGADAAIDFFLSKGVTVAMYHTSATYAEANHGIDKGITVATHLCNVMTGLHHRDVGVMGAAILRDEVWCELICDGLHVSLPMLEIILRLKDHGKLMMISDSGAYAGAPVGTYRSPRADGQSDRDAIHVTEEGFVLSNTGRLSGSSKPVIFGMNNLVEKLGLPLEEVIRLSSYNPHKKYGTADRKGSIAIGKDADIVVISDGFDALYTYSEGRLVYDHKADTSIFNQKFVEEFKM
jgi:N-acetylglucosamine-6-phosphate deacetylase